MARSAKTFGAPKSVSFEMWRWHVLITVEMQNGTVEKFVASADSAFTQSDGIWFGTAEDYDEGPVW